MHIVFGAAYYDSLAGAQQSLIPLLTETNDISPHVLCPSEGSLTEKIRDIGIQCSVVEYPDTLDRSGDEVVNFSPANILKIANSLLSYQKKIYDFLSAEDPDVLYCNNVRSALLFGWAAKALRIPIVMYARGDSKTRIPDELAQILASEIILIADGVSERFEQTTFSSPQFTVHTGVDIQRFNREHVFTNYRDRIDELSVNNKFVITQVSTINKRKAQLDLLKSIQNINEDYDILVRFVGNATEPEYEDKVKKFADENNLDSCVEFHGWQDEVRPYYYTTDLLALPSYNEGFPRNILEGLAMNVPVIATNAGGTDEVIKDQSTGVLVPIGKPQEMEKGIRLLIEDESLRQNISKRGQKVVRENYSNQKYGERFEELMTQLYS